MFTYALIYFQEEFEAAKFQKTQHTAAYRVAAQNMQNLAEMHVSLHGMVHYWGINMSLGKTLISMLQIPRLVTAGYLLTRTRDPSQ